MQSEIVSPHHNQNDEKLNLTNGNCAVHKWIHSPWPPFVEQHPSSVPFAFLLLPIPREYILHHLYRYDGKIIIKIIFLPFMILPQFKSGYCFLK